MADKRTLEIKHVADLLNMHFHIPNYQRGYRWESKHVEALLDDLYSFSIQMDETEHRQGKFYCLQPLAVVENNTLSTKEKKVYDVIDGQQRLTTLFLLLSYLQNTREALYTGSLSSSLFSLKYESRESNFFDKKEFKTSDIKKAICNIDFFYMTRAYRAIEEWFCTKNINKNVVLKVLIPENYRITEGLCGEALQKVKDINDKCNDARFIWYDVQTEANTDSIEVFSQLNYGKTALTSTELVKALLFQCDIYTTDTPLMREITFRRSCEWDAMEKQLQDPFMWSMFMQSDTTLTSHITIVLSLVCDELYEELLSKNPEVSIDKNSKDFIYQVCCEYLGNNKNGDYANNVENVWERIQTTYTALYNWYRNSDIYHLIGLLIWLKEYKNNNFDNEKRHMLVNNLLKKYSLVSKNKFIEYLKNQIAKIIHVNDSIKRNDGVIPWGLDYINYNDDPLQLIRILVTFNVEDIRKRQDESSRFPFHLLRDYNVTSLEHIHPQNLIMDNIKLDTITKWIEVKEESLKQLKKFDVYSEDFKKLKEYTVDESSYMNNKEDAHKIINMIDKNFDDLANMSERQMHTLYNMALVDKDLNSALSNNLLDRKREIIKTYQEMSRTYIMPTTQKVFSKHYSPVKESNVLPKLWTQPDREAYFDAIQKVYNEFDFYYSID